MQGFPDGRSSFFVSLDHDLVMSGFTLEGLRLAGSSSLSLCQEARMESAQGNEWISVLFEVGKIPALPDFLAVCSWASHISVASLSFLICTMGMIIAPGLYGCWEALMRK